MSSPYPATINAVSGPITLCSAEETKNWIATEQRAWAWMYGLDELRRHRYSDLISWLHVLRVAQDAVGSAAYIQKNAPNEATEHQHLHNAITELANYAQNFLMADSDAGRTIRRLAEVDPAFAVQAIHTYLHADGAGPPPATLWHYTTVPALLGILKSGTIWASDTSFVNDSSEITYAEQLLFQSLEYDSGVTWMFKNPNPAELDYNLWDAARRSFPGKAHLQNEMRWHRERTNTYIASFCEDENLLSQWRAYGSRQPIAIGFDRDELQRTAESHGGSIKRCFYDPQQQKKMMVETMRGHLQIFHDLQHGERTSKSDGPYTPPFDDAARVAVAAFSRLTPIFKHPDFREEREWRFVLKVGKTDLKGVHGDQTAIGMSPHFHIEFGKPPIQTRPAPRTEHPTSIINAIVVGPGPAQRATHDALAIELQTLWPTLPELRCSETPYVIQ